MSMNLLFDKKRITDKAHAIAVAPWLGSARLLFNAANLSVTL